MGVQEPSKSLHYVHCWGTCLAVWWVGHQRSICIKDLRISWAEVHYKGRKRQADKLNPAVKSPSSSGKSHSSVQSTKVYWTPIMRFWVYHGVCYSDLSSTLAWPYGEGGFWTQSGKGTFFDIYIGWLLYFLKGSIGLPWWRSGWESACQCRVHGFEPWSGKIPHAAEQLGPWTITTEPACLELVLRNKRGRDSEWPAHRDEEWPPLAATRESPRTETKTQHSQK